MNNSGYLRVRSPSAVIRRGYSNDEIAHIYELSRLFLESGFFRKGEAILRGLVEVAPDFAPAFLGLAYVHLQQQEYDVALTRARASLRLDPTMVEAMLMIVVCTLSTGDLTSAGSQLGEIRDTIEAGGVNDTRLVRLYAAQTKRWERLQGVS